MQRNGKKLMDFFSIGTKGGKAVEEEPETTDTPEVKEEAEQPEEPGEEPDAEQPEAPDSPEEPNEPEAQASLGADQVAINATELQTLRADAAEWNAKKAEYETLKAWYDTQTGKKARVSKDANDQEPNAKKSWQTAPWNQPKQ